jgi:hypothetical protein
MDCIAPEEIKEGDLIAFIESRASERVRDHIARCAFCAAEAAALAQVDCVLEAALYRESCPGMEALVQYQAGLLRARERRQIKRHVQACTLCAEELQRLSVLDAPSYSLWEEMRRAARDVIEAVQWTPSLSPTAAMRGGRSGQRMYRAGEVDLALASEVERPLENLWTLRGRVTRAGVAATDLTGHTVRLIQGQRIVASQSIDDLGYFSFGLLAAGRYELWLEQPGADSVIRDLVVGLFEANGLQAESTREQE